jgi:hypothetical protein
MPAIDTIKPRGGTAAQWTAANPVLALRELGVETDTGADKLGDGVTAWNSLAYRFRPGAFVTSSGTVAGQVPQSLGNGAFAGAPLKPPIPQDAPGIPFVMAPVAVAGGFVFQPQVGDLSWVQDGEAHGAAPTSDFSLMIGSTWFENIVYSSITPNGNDGWTATATVGSGTTVTVSVSLTKLATGVWRKRIVLIASANTTVQLFQGYSAPSGPIWRHLGYDTPVLNTPITITGFPMVGVAAPSTAAGSTARSNVQAFCLMPDTGVGGSWGYAPATNGFIYGGSGKLGLYAGLGIAGVSALSLTAGVPTTVGFTHFTAPIYDAFFSSTWTSVSIEALRRRCHAVAALVHGSTASDPFTQMLTATARARVGKASAADASGAFLIPAQNYPNCYVRDSFWTQMGLMDANISKQLLSRFAANLNGSNLAPIRAALNQTTGAITYDQYWWTDATCLLLMWAYWHLTTFGEAVLTGTQISNLIGAIEANLDASFYPVGDNSPGSGWFDSISSGLPTQRTSAQMTGLCYVALRCATYLGGTVTSTVLNGVKSAYQSFYVGGWVRTFFDRSGYTDPLAFVDVFSIQPEFWSQYLIGESLLTDAQVASHLNTVFSTNVKTMPAGRAFACIVNQDGSYLPASDFNAVYPGQSVSPPGGVYQNGGSWLLHDFLCLATGRLHNYVNQDLDAMWRDRIAAETSVDWTLHEHIATSSAGAYPLGSCFNLAFAYGWNAAIAALENFAGLKR